MVKRRANDSDLERFWRLAIERQKASGLSISAFCDSEGLKDHRFWYWERKLKLRNRARRGSKLGRDRTRQPGFSQDVEQDAADRRRSLAEAKQSKKEEQFWLAILEEWQESGVSLREFAQRRMVGYRALCRWKRKLLPESGSEAPQAESEDVPQHDFVPVRLVGDDQVKEAPGGDAEKAVVEIVLKSGRLIRITSNCPLDFLAAVISAAEVN